MNHSEDFLLSYDLARDRAAGRLKVWRPGADQRNSAHHPKSGPMNRTGVQIITPSISPTSPPDESNNLRLNDHEISGAETEAQLVAVIQAVLAEVLPPLVDEAIRKNVPRYAMGDDLPINLSDVEAILPISLKQLKRLRKNGTFRMLKLPDTDKPITTVGALKALLRKAELE